MSLTILFHRRSSEVAMIEWFRDPNVSVNYATGPVIRMSREEFRSSGLEFVRRHFHRYLSVRLAEQDATSVFEPAEEAEFLADCTAVRIRMEEQSGDLTPIPQRFTKYALDGLESFGADTRRTISNSASPDVFWKALEEVRTTASSV